VEFFKICRRGLGDDARQNICLREVFKGGNYIVTILLCNGGKRKNQYYFARRNEMSQKVAQ
jgi:hypothetical protein